MLFIPFKETSGQCYKTVLCNYVAIGITTVKIIRKYAASGVNYALKSFILFATVVPHFLYVLNFSFRLIENFPKGQFLGNMLGIVLFLVCDLILFVKKPRVLSLTKRLLRVPGLLTCTY